MCDPQLQWHFNMLGFTPKGNGLEVIYVCNGCGTDIVFKGSNVQKCMGNITTIGASIIVAFIISGCLFATYYNWHWESIVINILLITQCLKGCTPL